MKKKLLPYLTVSALISQRCVDCDEYLEEDTNYCDYCGCTYNVPAQAQAQNQAQENDLSDFTRKEIKFFKRFTPKSKKMKSLKKIIKKNKYNQFPVPSVAIPLADTVADYFTYGLTPGFRKNTTFSATSEGGVEMNYNLTPLEVELILTALANIVYLNPARLVGIFSTTYPENCPEDNIYDSESGMILWGNFLRMTEMIVSRNVESPEDFSDLIEVFVCEVDELSATMLKPEAKEERSALFEHFEAYKEHKFDKIFLRLFSTRELLFAKAVNDKTRDGREIYYLETNKLCEFDGHIPMTLDSLPVLNEDEINKCVKAVVRLDDNGLYQ